MKHRARLRDLGSHPDVYGRMWWDRWAVTIKRECGHIGNGRYAHPEQDRLCTVREMAILQGFPAGYTFVGTLTNRYRHIGDAVPPLISYQLAALAQWMLTGRRPESASEPARRHLTAADIEALRLLAARTRRMGAGDGNGPAGRREPQPGARAPARHRATGRPSLPASPPAWTGRSLSWTT